MQRSSVPKILRLIVLSLCVELYQCYLVAVDPGKYYSPVVKSRRAAIGGGEPRMNSENNPAASSSPATLGSKPPEPEHVDVVEVQPTRISTTADDADGVWSDPTKSSDDGPDGQAVQRTFLVLAGLGIIVVGYLVIKFACAKKRRRDGDEESQYGLVETSEMDLLDNDDDEEGEDDTLFDLQSHRRT